MRILIVSNRLPVTVIEKGGKLRFQQSTGGLVSGLSTYLDSLSAIGGSAYGVKWQASTNLSQIKSAPTNYMWVGWPGGVVEDVSKEELTKSLLKLNAYPVLLSEKTMDKFYYGFCNKIIWPLFHYFPSYVVYDEDYWNHYKIVNETFCNAITEIINKDDIVWIQDYHLMLLPKLLRDKFPDMQIGFFLHIPFPIQKLSGPLPYMVRTSLHRNL